jgi:hypothetical protein
MTEIGFIQKSRFAGILAFAVLTALLASYLLLSPLLFLVSLLPLRIHDVHGMSTDNGIPAVTDVSSVVDAPAVAGS